MPTLLVGLRCHPSIFCSFCLPVRDLTMHFRGKLLCCRSLSAAGSEEHFSLLLPYRASTNTFLQAGFLVLVWNQAFRMFLTGALRPSVSMSAEICGLSDVCPCGCVLAATPASSGGSSGALTVNRSLWASANPLAGARALYHSVIFSALSLSLSLTHTHTHTHTHTGWQAHKHSYPCIRTYSLSVD